MKRFKSLDEVEKFAKEQIRLHLGCFGKFKWFNGRSCFGYCEYGYISSIKLSKPHVQLNMHLPHEIVDVILHEIAHALNYRRNGSSCDGHGKDWKSICLEIGAKPTTFYYGAVVTPRNKSKDFRFAMIRKSTGKVLELHKTLPSDHDYLFYSSGKWSKVSKANLELVRIKPMKDFDKSSVVPVIRETLPRAINERRKKSVSNPSPVDYLLSDEEKVARDDEYLKSITLSLHQRLFDEGRDVLSKCGYYRTLEWVKHGRIFKEAPVQVENISELRLEQLLSDCRSWLEKTSLDKFPPYKIKTKCFPCGAYIEDSKCGCDVDYGSTHDLFLLPKVSGRYGSKSFLI